MTFDITKLDTNKFYVTRDGRKVKIAGVNLDAGKNNIIVGWTYNSDDTYCNSWSSDGQWRQGCIGGGDIVGEWQGPKRKMKVKLWINFYPGGGFLVWNSKSDADACDEVPRIACKHIEFEYEEGEGLRP